MNERRWISPRECAQRLGLHPQTIYQKFYSGELPGGRLGRTVRIDWPQVEKRLEFQPK
jgi:excisionase family DNA binding protein